MDYYYSPERAIIFILHFLLPVHTNFSMARMDFFHNKKISKQRKNISNVVITRQAQTKLFKLFIRLKHAHLYPKGNDQI